jgi:hypothetical protein
MYKLLLLELREDTVGQEHIAIIADLRPSTSKSRFGVRLHLIGRALY